MPLIRNISYSGCKSACYSRHTCNSERRQWYTRTSGRYSVAVKIAKEWWQCRRQNHRFHLESRKLYRSFGDDSSLQGHTDMFSLYLAFLGITYIGGGVMVLYAVIVAVGGTTEVVWHG